MNQHFVQKSWLKQFESADGKVEVVVTESLESVQRQPQEIATEPDFQRVDSEKEDGRIESEAIRVIHCLKKGLSPVPDNKRSILEEWVALHLARSPRSREALQDSSVSYSRARSSFVAADLAFVRSFGEVWIYRAEQSEEPLILSDNPISDMEGIALVVPISPRAFVMFSRQDPRQVSIEGRSWTQLANEASFAHATIEVYGNPDTKPPWHVIRERALRNTRIEVRESQVRVS